jgi:hypothetical protein
MFIAVDAEGAGTSAAGSILYWSTKISFQQYPEAHVTFSEVHSNARSVDEGDGVTILSGVFHAQQH